VPKIDPAATAFHAAGIASALATMESEDVEDVARFHRVTEEYGGHVGVIHQVVKAAWHVERFRVKHGASARWGGELPYLYDVWDAIARAIRQKLDLEPLDQMVESAIESVTDAETIS
jgi:hypothetical protein